MVGASLVASAAAAGRSAAARGTVADDGGGGAAAAAAAAPQWAGTSADAAEVDRYLVCLTDYYGYGNWAHVRNAMRACDRFRFDHVLRSLSVEAVGKRCLELLRLVERELAEIDAAGAEPVPSPAVPPDSR